MDCLTGAEGPIEIIEEKTRVPNGKLKMERFRKMAEEIKRRKLPEISGDQSLPKRRLLTNGEQQEIKTNVAVGNEFPNGEHDR